LRNFNDFGHIALLIKQRGVLGIKKDFTAVLAQAAKGAVLGLTSV